MGAKGEKVKNEHGLKERDVYFSFSHKGSAGEISPGTSWCLRCKESNFCLAAVSQLLSCHFLMVLEGCRGSSHVAIHFPASMKAAIGKKRDDQEESIL